MHVKTNKILAFFAMSWFAIPVFAQQPENSQLEAQPNQSQQGQLVNSENINVNGDGRPMMVSPIRDDLSQIDQLNREILLSKKKLDLLELQKKMKESAGSIIEQSLPLLKDSTKDSKKQQESGETPMVRSVSIIGEDKEAIILYSDGYVIARKGMVLPDGSTVEEITMNGVLTNKNGVRRTLVYGTTIPFPRY